MRCVQIEYTSCRLGEYAGFQVRAATPEVETLIGEADMDEVIRMGLYRPPLQAGTAPVAFRAFRLSSGRQVLQHSRYLGLDDTGREGNFRTRSLVAQCPEDMLPRWVMEYYDWPGWEDAGQWHDAASPCGATQPHPLAVVSLTDVQSGDAFSCRELHLFLREEPNRARWLTAMLESLFRPSGQRRLVVRDEKENNPFWLACITRLLPRPVANGLHVSTCQPDLRGFELAAVPPRCAVDADTLFEPGPGEPSRVAVPRAGRIYARKAVGLLLRAPEAVPGFLHGIDGFMETLLHPVPLDTAL